MKTFCTLALTLAASSAVLAAAPSGGASASCPTHSRFVRAIDYRQEFVPADAAVVLHLDLKNLRASQLGKVLTKLRGEMQIDELDELREKLGFDPLQVVDSITAYGSGDDQGTFGAVLVASAAIDGALEKLPEQEGYRSLSKGGIDFFQFDDLVGSWHIMESGERLVIVGKSLEVALRGHQVIHGDVPSQGPNSRLAMPIPGSILFVAGGGELLQQASVGMASGIMERATGGQLELGEANGNLNLRIGVQTGSREEAQDIRETLGGVLAVGRMFLAGNDELPNELVGLLRSINLTVEGKSVSLSLSVPIKEAMQIVQSADRR